MKTTFAFSVGILSLYLVLSVDILNAQVTPTSMNGTAPCCDGKSKGDQHRGHPRNQNRVTRAAPPPPDMEEKIKDFATMLGKTPDELRAAFGKFMLTQGVSLQQMEEAVQHGNQVALQIIENIKKAMHT